MISLGLFEGHNPIDPVGKRGDLLFNEIRKMAAHIIRENNIYLPQFEVDGVVYNVYDKVTHTTFEGNLYQYIKYSLVNKMLTYKAKYGDEFDIEDYIYMLEIPDTKEDNVYKSELFEELKEGLSIWYNKEEIEYHLPLTVQLAGIVNDGKTNNPDLKLFMDRFKAICFALRDKYGVKKNPAKNKIKDVEKLINSALTSTLLLSLVNSEDEKFHINNSLLMALDYKNLYRLMEIAGGTTITIPTLSQFNSIITSVSHFLNQRILSKKVERGDRVFDNYLARSVNYSQGLLLDKLDKIHNFNVDNTCEGSIKNMLEDNLNILKVLLGKIKDEDINTGTTLNLFRKVQETINELCNTLIKITKVDEDDSSI